jgi:ribonuclease-3
MLIKLQEILNYHFTDEMLLREALSHPSLHGNNQFLGKDYERLEFLGDAVVNLIITDILYQRFKSLVEGDLAKIRAYLVSKDFMVKIAGEIQLSDYIIMGSSEEISGGRYNPNNLENVLEAILGAIYLDGGLEKAMMVVSKFWSQFIKADIAEFADPKTALQELLQERGVSLPKYEVVCKAGSSHAPEFEVACIVESVGSENGYGKSIKSAAKEAAIKMLARINVQ